MDAHTLDNVKREFRDRKCQLGSSRRIASEEAVAHIKVRDELQWQQWTHINGCAHMLRHVTETMDNGYLSKL